MHEDLRPQIAAIRRLLGLIGVPVLDCPTYEADDILATLAQGVEQLGGKCLLVSGDKDCRQLITDQVKIYNLRKDKIFDRQSLRTEWGIRPEQVVDFLSLVGDSSDGCRACRKSGPSVPSSC